MLILVTNAHSRMAYAAVCSLGRRGHKVFTADYLPSPMAACSRFASGHESYPSPYREPEAFITALGRIIARRGIELLLPIYDETFIIAKYRDRLPADVIIPIETWDKIFRLHDKYSLMRLAGELGVRTPRTYMAQDGLSLADIAERLEFPVVLKPVRGAGAFGVAYARTPEELERLYHSFDRERHQNELMIQEYIPGQVCCQVLLCQAGEVRARFAYRQLREYPLSGGTATWRESIRLPEMEEALGTILRALEWNGICQADFIVSGRNGLPYLTDCNPRFWGSLKQAIASGVDFPHLLCQLAKGASWAAPPDYKLGVKTLWIWGDVRVLAKRLTNGKGKLAALGDFLSSLWRAEAFDDFEPSDPLPFFAYPVQVSREMLKNRTLKPPRGGV